MSNDAHRCNPNTAAAATAASAINVANVVWSHVHLHTYIHKQSVSVCVARLEENNWCCAPLPAWIYDTLNTGAFIPVRQLGNWTPTTTHERVKDITRGRWEGEEVTRGVRRMPRQWVKKKKKTEKRGREGTQGWRGAHLEGKPVIIRPRREPLMCLHFLPGAQRQTAGH